MFSAEDPAPLKPRSSAFADGDNDDDDDEVAAPPPRRPPVQYKEVVPEVDDPSIYDYDGQYDSFKPSLSSSKTDNVVSKDKGEPVSETSAASCATSDYLHIESSLYSKSSR